MWSLIQKWKKKVLVPIPDPWTYLVLVPPSKHVIGSFWRIYLVRVHSLSVILLIWPERIKDLHYQVVPSLPSAGPVQNQPMFGMPPPPPLPSVGPMQHPMFGMPPAPPLPNQLMSLNQTGKSTIDMENIPRPSPSSAVILHETRRANQANPPPVFFIIFVYFNSFHFTTFYVAVLAPVLYCNQLQYSPMMQHIYMVLLFPDSLLYSLSSLRQAII